MKRIFIILALVSISYVASAGIPDTTTHKWGVMQVPEDYGKPDGKTIKIYWEKLCSISSDSQAIVMINGGPGCTHDSFHHLNQNGGYEKDWFDALRSHFDIYYFDQRGTGHSSQLTPALAAQSDLTQYGTENTCRDMEELRKTIIKKDKIAVLGESYGGMAALSYTVMYPDSVSNLIVHDSCPSNDYYVHMHKNLSDGIEKLDAEVFPGIKVNFQKTLQRIDERAIITSPPTIFDRNTFLNACLPLTYNFQSQEYLAILVKELAANGQSQILNNLVAAGYIIPISQVKWDDPKYASLFTTFLVQALEMLDEKAIGTLAAEQPCAPYNLEWLDKAILRVRRDLRKDCALDRFTPYDVTNRLSSIHVPTLMIVGKYDMVTPMKYASVIQKGIGTSCKMMIVDGAAHGGFIEQSGSVIPAIQNFLLRTESSQKPLFSIQTIIAPKRVTRTSYPTKEEIIKAYLEGLRRM